MTRSDIKAIVCYHLPVPVGVTGPVLGSRFRASINGLPATIHLPGVKWTQDDRPLLTAPTVSWLSTAHLEWTHARANPDEFRDWGHVRRYRPSSQSVAEAFIHTVAVTFKGRATGVEYLECLDGVGSPTGATVRGWALEIEAWFRRFATWIEVAVGQDLDADNPFRNVEPEARGLAITIADGDVISSPGTSNLRVIKIEKTPLVSATGFRSATRRASSGQTPDVAHILLRDARIAGRRGRRRIAAIDAGSALEVALADFNRNHVRANVGTRPTLGTYCRNHTIAEAAKLPATIHADVVDVRNSAIHDSAVPSGFALARALTTVHAVVNRVDPLPLY